MKTKSHIGICSLIVGAALTFPAQSALASQVRRYDLSCEFKALAADGAHECLAQAHLQLANPAGENHAPPEFSALETNQLRVICNNNVQYSSSAVAIVKREGYVIQGQPGPIPAIELGLDALSRGARGMSTAANLSLDANQSLAGACSVYALDDEQHEAEPAPAPTFLPAPQPQPTQAPDPAADVSLTADSSDNQFGIVSVGDISNAKTIKVVNSGSAKITKLAVEIAGDNSDEFVIGADSCSSAALAPGESCSVAVYFLPRSAGKKLASVMFGDGHNPLASSLVEGEAVAPVGDHQHGHVIQ